MASLAGEYDVVLVVRSDGVLAADIRPLVRVSVTVIVEQDGRREMGSSGGGGRYSIRLISATPCSTSTRREAVKAAVVNLDARPAPAGPMTIVLGPAGPACCCTKRSGHGPRTRLQPQGLVGVSRADRRARGGQGRHRRRRRHAAGPARFVETWGPSGNPTQCTTLIEDRILKGYIQDTMNARLIEDARDGQRAAPNRSPTCPCRAHDDTPNYAGRDKDPEEILASVKNGLYAVNFGGGQVDITNGKFVFSASEAYMIENGKVTYSVKAPR